ncbi:uncharacterized protein PAC_03428 [Phialocephala subalpina]|uniref:Xylanolytic transcriptional activator regulatory domain-containing protein n=1 Tax=Phialocephala subalpina TaxID=576137 RepID=A0A1L7WL85_9HELO|nr:uncharacterized protein PAC_03428 [Phialocephala subalpina]
MEKSIRNEQLSLTYPLLGLIFCFELVFFPEIYTLIDYAAYFREFETVFSFVCRTAFEADLRAYFNPNAKAPECPASYALRHVVYAGGKRSIIKNNSAAAFDEIHAQSWPYFENALYVHTDLLYSKCSITAVQALMAMSIYVEGIGCPSLEYMLCSNAVRLAQSKGLHRQPPIAWNLPESEVQQRKWLFWAIYCYDKHISYRSGRPSAIEDDTITCSIPTSIPPGSNHDIIWCTNVIKLTYILSAVMKYIQTLQNKETKTKDILKPVEALNARIIEWKKQVPFPFQPDEDIVVSGLSPKVHIYCVLFMRFHYYGTLVALNSAFVYPWIFANRKREHDRLFQDQVRRSTDLVVEASREIIKNTKYVDIDYACPVWLAFYYPMVGLINLFIHVLRYPTLSSVQMDLALIDIATGHFARVGYTSSHSISFPFARELARLAHEAVRATYWGSELLNLELSDVNGIGEHQNQEIISLNDNPQGFREELNRSSDLVDEARNATLD